MLEEEVQLVHRAVEVEMASMQAGRTKTHSFAEIKKILKSEYEPDSL